MSTSIATGSVQKTTQLSTKQTKIQNRNQADEDHEKPSNVQNVKQNGNSNSSNNDNINDNKKKSQISTNQNSKNDDSKNKQNSNNQQNEINSSQATSKSPFKLNQATHNNGYYSQKSYLEQRNQELEENFINKNIQIGEAIEKSQKDIRLKLSQQSHIADIFQQQPHQSLSDWKQDQYNKNAINIQIQNTSSNFIPQTPELNNGNEINNYYDEYQNEQNQYGEYKKQNLKPSDTKLSDYLNLRNQVNSPSASVHQRLYHQAVSQQKQQQQMSQLSDKQQNIHQSIFSVGSRNYPSERHSQKFRSSSNKKQRPTYYSGSKIVQNDEGSFVNDNQQYVPNNFPQKYFSSSQDFGQEGDNSFINNNNQMPPSYQKQKNVSNPHHRAQSNNRYQSRQEQKRLNLPQIDQNSFNVGMYPHSSTARSSQKTQFSRQQSPLGSSNQLATPNSRTPRISYNRRDSATRIKDLGNSIQERYSDKIEKMKMKYSSKNPFSQNINLDDELDSHRYHHNSQNDGQPYNIQRKEFQQTIQQAAINIEEQRQKIRKHEEQRDQELINQNYTYKDYNRRSNDFSPRVSQQEGQNRQRGEQINSFRQSLNDNDAFQRDVLDNQKKEQLDKGNYVFKDQIRKLSSYNLKLNTAEEKIQKILTKEDTNFQENPQMVKQFSQSSKMQSNGLDNMYQQQIRRGSLQNLDKFTDNQYRIDHVSMNQRDLLNENSTFMQNEKNYSNSPQNNSLKVPRSDSKVKRIQQNYYYDQDPQNKITDNQEFVTLSNAIPQTPQQNQQQYNNDDDFSRNQTRNENDYGDNFTIENNNIDNTQNTNIDEIYSRKRENVVKRVQEKLYSLNDRMETFDNVGDLKQKKTAYHNLNPKIIENIKTPQKNQQLSYRQQANNQQLDTFDNTNDVLEKSNLDQNKAPKQNKENHHAPQNQQIVEQNRSSSKRRSSVQRDSSNSRYPHKSQNTTLIDTFEGEKNNLYNQQNMGNNQKLYSKDSSRFDTFDSKIKNQQSINTQYQQKMKFLDKRLANLQELKEKQKRQYFIESDNPRLQEKQHRKDKIEEEEERYPNTNSQYYDEQQYNNYQTPKPNLRHYQQEDKNKLDYSPQQSDKNTEIKNYNMVKKQPVKAINKNMNDLEKIQSNLGNLEKQLEQLNQKYHKYQPSQQTEEKDMEDRLFTFQVDERIYKKFKKYLPQDITQRANQVQKYEQYSTQLSDKKKFEEQQQLEDFLDNQIKNQLQKFLPLDVSQRLQIENDSQNSQPLEGSQMLDKNPNLEDYINKKIQERLMAYLPNDVISRMNELPYDNQKSKKSNQNIN